MAETVSAARCMRVKVARSVRLALGLGNRRRRILVKTPSVPSEPMKTSRSE